MNGNQCKEEDFRIPDALEALFRSTEQTYEEFMSSFTTLTADDVAAYHLRGAVAGRSNSASVPTHDAANTTPVNATDEAIKVQTAEHTEDLQEEVLEEGTKATPFLMRTANTTGGTLLKVDNFVDNEGSGSSSDESDGANSDTETAYQPSCLSASEQKTETTARGGMETETNSEKQLSRVQGENQTSPRTVCDSETKNSESCEGIITGDVTRVTTSSQKKELNSDLSSDANAEDAAETLHSGKSAEEITEELLNEENSGQYETMPLPGEAEDIPESPKEHQIQNHTLLEMACTSKSSIKTANEGTDVLQQPTSDEVEPFSLDEEFDYDNVILTPKWETGTLPPQWKDG